MSAACQCTLAGWCERHNVKKTANHVRLCQQGGDYWHAWERGSGPGQAVPQDNDRASKMKERAIRIRAQAARKKRLIGWLKFFRVPSDTGLGDTVMRLKKLAGRRAIKDEIRQVERMCSCQTRDAIVRLNQQYPYTTGEGPSPS